MLMDWAAEETKFAPLSFINIDCLEAGWLIDCSSTLKLGLVGRRRFLRLAADYSIKGSARAVFKARHRVDRIIVPVVCISTSML